MSHTIRPETAVALQGLQLHLLWKPDAGLPVSVQLYPAQATPTVNVMDQLEMVSSGKLTLAGSARAAGQATARAWLWNDDQSTTIEMGVGLFLDDCIAPPGELTAGHAEVLVYAPQGALATRYHRPHMLEPLGDGPWWAVRFPRTNWPDGTFRVASLVLSALPDKDAAMREAWTAVVAPRWRIGREPWFGAPHQTSPARAAAMAAQGRQRWQSWTMGAETDPWADWNQNRNTGASGYQDRFGVASMPELQQGLSEYAADWYRGMLLAIEGHRPTWLDQAQSDSTQKSNLPGSTYQFYTLYHLSESRVGRAGWSVDKPLNYGNYHLWTGPNIEHHWSEMTTLAGLIRCPMTRDLAIWYARRACTSWSSHGHYEGGHYNGGNQSNYRREMTRPWGTIALGWQVAKLWGLDAQAAALEQHMIFKVGRIVTEPDGYRTAKDWKGRVIPYTHTAMSFGSASGRLTAEDIAGTPLEAEGDPLQRIACEASWQTMALGPALVWALRAQNVHALTIIRDLQYQVVESFLVGNPVDLMTYRICKYGSMRFLGLGHKWQDPTLDPAAYGRVMEHWLQETLGAGIFDDRGVDGPKRARCYQALLAVNPAMALGDWGTDPAAWDALRALHGMPVLPAPPVGRRQVEWMTPI